LESTKKRLSLAELRPDELRLAGRHCQKKIIQIGDLEFQVLVFTDFDREVLAAIDKVETDRLCPLYGQIWPAAITLCEYLATYLRAKPMAGQRVLELGCGLALPSLVIARLGGQVTATDTHPEVGEFVALHQLTNGIPASNLEYCTFDFTAATFVNEDLENSHWDYIIASDILYEPKHYPSLIKKLAALSGQQTQIIVADPGRVGLEKFIDLMASSGFLVRHQTCSPNGCLVLLFSSS